MSTTNRSDYNHSSESTELPFDPLLFDTRPYDPMPIGPPDTTTLTAMPELHVAAVITDDDDWRQHPRWKPLIGTPSRSPLCSGTLIPDPSPQKTLPDGDNVPMMPEGSFVHKRRRADYIQRPPVWHLRTTASNLSLTTSTNELPDTDQRSLPGMEESYTRLDAITKEETYDPRGRDVLVSFPNLQDAVFDEKMKLLALQWSRKPIIAASLHLAEECLETDTPLSGSPPSGGDREPPMGTRDPQAATEEKQDQDSDNTSKDAKLGQMSEVPSQAMSETRPLTKMEKIRSTVRKFFTKGKGKKKRVALEQVTDASHEATTSSLRPVDASSHASSVNDERAQAVSPDNGYGTIRSGHLPHPGDRVHITGESERYDEHTWPMALHKKDGKRHTKIDSLAESISNALSRKNRRTGHSSRSGKTCASTFTDLSQIEEAQEIMKEATVSSVAAARSPRMT